METYHIFIKDNTTGQKNYDKWLLTIVEALTK